MRAIYIILLLLLLIPVAMADEGCPFPVTPQELKLGSFMLDSQITGVSTGSLVAREGAGYEDPLASTVYRYNAVSVGMTDYTSSFTLGTSLNADKVLTMGGGSAYISEGYAQTNMALTNLTYDDAVTGGSYASIIRGEVISSTALNAPIDTSYTVAMTGINNGLAVGVGSVYLNAYSMEGSNATLIDTQRAHVSSTWTGEFEFAAVNTLRISHPISQNYQKIASTIH